MPAELDTGSASPRTWAPVYEKFKAEFEKHSVNESTILIGHLRWRV